MYSTAYIWAKILNYMEKQLTAPIVSTWFDDAEIVDLTDTKLILSSGSDFHREFIQSRCIGYIQAGLRELFELEREVEVLSDSERKSYHTKSAPSGIFDLNPQFTFDKFVVGPSNRFAHAAALSVAEETAKDYNPLFIYGQSGLGKTHLLYAIGETIHRNHPDYKIIYTKGDQFTNELISALRDGKNFEFRKKYRNADLFLVDDVQFIAGKDSTQEEFFHTFNNLYENNRQIVLTADRPPNEMLRLEDRLKTRFEWGLLADIEPPDYETRMAIIMNKATSLGLEFPDEVCHYIAENITTNIRQIEGTVKKIQAYHELDKMPLDLAHVSRAIKDMHKSEADALPTPALIITEVCHFYSIEEQVIRSTNKNKNISEARQVAMYLIRKMTNLSLPEIGAEFKKDHTTILYGINRIEQTMESSPVLKDVVREITENINSRL